MHGINESLEIYRSRYTDKIIKCDDCIGRGEVKYKFYSSITHKTDTLVGECPTCGGAGENDVTICIETGEEENEHPTALIKIGSALFDAEQLSAIVSAAKLLEYEKIKLVAFNGDYRMHKFKMGDVIICIMPVEARQLDKQIIVEVKPML